MYVEHPNRERAMLQVLKNEAQRNFSFSLRIQDKVSIGFWQGYVEAIEDVIYFSEHRTENIRPMVHKDRKEKNDGQGNVE